MSDLIQTHNLDVLVLNEIWIPSDAPDIIKFDAVPDGYRMTHVHRGDHLRTRGGLAVIYTVIMSTSRKNLAGTA